LFTKLKLTISPAEQYLERSKILKTTDLMSYKVAKLASEPPAELCILKAVLFYKNK
jgi:hypothetical protein